MYQTAILHNGLRLIHHRVPGKAAYCGLLVNAGSRDEREEETGIAHFIEHLIFKGTKKRKAYHILSRMEDVGGELNAYTTKEETCVHATFMPVHYERALELFADILFHSTFPRREMEKEKEVIIDEINSYKDNPAELIFDDFDEMLYEGHPIARNILGSAESVRQLDSEAIARFIARNYHPARMVISSVGDIPFEKLLRVVERHFAHYPPGTPDTGRVAPGIYTPRRRSVEKTTHQGHCVIGNIAYDHNREERVALSLLANILGGMGMNSRLNLNIRERHGLAYNIEASYTPYSDTGCCLIYFGCDKGNVKRCIDLCMKELQRLRDQPVGPLQLKRARAQLIGQITISSENGENMMLANGKSFLVYDKVDTLEEAYVQINAVTPETLTRVAREIFDVEKQSVLVYR
ncbi:MAG: insulinase family protein [Odoribacteraceae bacterium]|jgi:predicted Zn-dependent peptidase|nr:insulinase family protein [Odoribacteraceae bacterium]